jgi:probable phosphoglycerate mutase
VLVRHGETDWNAEARMQGWAPVPLNDRGRAQADAVASWLADEFDVDRVHASDLQRTRETAERILRALSVDESEVEYDPAWRERDLGVYQGLPLTTADERFPEFALGEAAARAHGDSPESGESLAAVHERVVDAFEGIVSTAAPGETRLVVTHGGPIHLLLGHLKGFDIERAVLEHAMDNCAVVVLDCADGVEVVRENVTDWLAGTGLEAEHVG